MWLRPSWLTFGLVTAASGCFAEFPPLETDPVGTESCVVKAVVGVNHTCLLTSDGQVLCFGSNEFGQLGDLTLDSRPNPVAVELPESAVDVGAGDAHTCAALTSGRVFCWGNNERAQLGDAMLPNQSRPIEVADVKADRIVVSGWHACALFDSTLACFGWNNDYQLTEAGGQDGRPIEVSLSGPVVDVALGDGHTCAQLGDGSVWCWGFNGFAQTGVDNGVTGAVRTPNQVNLPATAKAIAAGFSNSCAILKDDTVYCWGSSRNGRLADDFSDQPISMPVAIAQLGTSADRVRIGEGPLMVRRDDGAWLVWGDNSNALFGNGTTASSVDPIETPLSGADVSLGAAHGCVVAKPGVSCWGSNVSGQLGAAPSSEIASRPILAFACSEE
jgi:alpha-tubulin suppressor-like RCC1 family protein